MTGTSVDGLDAALVRVSGHGEAMRAELLDRAERPLGAWGERLRAIAEQRETMAGEIAEVARGLSLLHVEAVAGMLGERRADLVCVHGQTVYHRPPVSWQLINAPVIAHGLKTKVVFDLRGMDLAAGGQGAPITPMADWVLFADEQPRAVVNLGGFANVTLLPARAKGGLVGAVGLGGGGGVGGVRGGDVCAVNHVLDAIARRVLGVAFDRDGAAALSGRVHEEALDDLMGVFAAQSRSGRSLGTGDEVVSWIGRQWRGGAGVSGPDLCATACEAIASTVAERVRGAELVVLAGGGAKNRGLVAALESCCTGRVVRSETLGMPVEAREAAGFAVLGALCEDRAPITIPEVTGGPAGLISGAWVYP
jgi:1,6-anhydro-N-acetylmuramate kinase